MQRRGFLKRVFGGSDHVDASMFALQIVVRDYAVDELRAKLHAIIEAPERAPETPAQRRVFYKKLSAVLGRCVPFFDYGYWEYVTGASAAAAGFHEWVSEIEGEMATEAEETGEVDETERFEVEKRYVVVTVVLLLGGPVPAAAEYDPDADDAWTRRAFGHLLGALPAVDWERVEADAVYLMPGNDEDGFSEWDLADDGWSHLEPLVG